MSRSQSATCQFDGDVGCSWYCNISDCITELNATVSTFSAELNATVLTFSAELNATVLPIRNKAQIIRVTIKGVNIIIQHFYTDFL